MFLRMEGNLIAVHVDPSDPTAWRRDNKQQVVVYVKNRVTVIFPNKEVDVGSMNPGDELVVREGWGPQGRDWKAFIEARVRA
jgi:hypothetical protein